jgi:hypothetical protein
MPESLTVRELVQQTEDQLMEIRNFGETTLVEVREKLQEMGLHLGMKVPRQSIDRLGFSLLQSNQQFSITVNSAYALCDTEVSADVLAAAHRTAKP